MTGQSQALSTCIQYGCFGKRSFFFVFCSSRRRLHYRSLKTELLQKSYHCEDEGETGKTVFLLCSVRVCAFALFVYVVYNVARFCNGRDGQNTVTFNIAIQILPMITLTVPLCSNSLFNAITEVVQINFFSLHCSVSR